jgi:hypothetical protein
MLPGYVLAKYARWLNAPIIGGTAIKKVLS